MQIVSEEKLQTVKQQKLKTLAIVAFLILVGLVLELIALCILLKHQPTFEFFKPLNLTTVSQKRGEVVQPWIGAAFFFAGLGAIYLIYKMNNQFKNGFKAQIIQLIIWDKFPNFRYSPTGFIAEEKYRQSGHSLFEYNRYTGEDLLQGDIEGVGIEICQLYLGDTGTNISYKNGIRTKTKNKARQRTAVIFQGDFMVIATQNIPINAQVEILDGVLDKKFADGMPKAGSHKRKLELNPSKGFRSYYSVYTDDENEAQRLLQPALAEFLTQQAAEKQLIYLSLHPEAVYLSMPTNRDFLKIGLFTTINQELLTTYQSEIAKKITLAKTIIDLLPRK